MHSIVLCLSLRKYREKMLWTKCEDNYRHLLSLCACLRVRKCHKLKSSIRLVEQKNQIFYFVLHCRSEKWKMYLLLLLEESTTINAHCLSVVDSASFMILWFFEFNGKWLKHIRNIDSKSYICINFTSICVQNRNLHTNTINPFVFKWTHEKQCKSDEESKLPMATRSNGDQICAFNWNGTKRMSEKETESEWERKGMRETHVEMHFSHFAIWKMQSTTKCNVRLTVKRAELKCCKLTLRSVRQFNNWNEFN